MKDVWEAIDARREVSKQLRRHLTWRVGLQVVGAAAVVASATLISVHTIEPVSRMLVVGGALILSLPPLIRWQHLGWAKRSASVGGMAFATGVIVDLAEPNDLIGNSFVIGALLIWSALPVVLWKSLTWTWRSVAAAGSVLLLADVIQQLAKPQSASLESVVGWIVEGLLFLALLFYSATQLSHVAAPPATRALIFLSVVFLYGFPPLLAFLASNGGADFITLFLQRFNSGYGWLGLIQLLLQAAVPLLLIAVPEVLRKRLTDTERSATVEALLPVELAVGAVLATGLYTVTLHFAKGPLANVSTNQLTFAAIAVMVLLTPFYKSISTVCWERGITDAFDSGAWVATQKELMKVLGKAFTEPTKNTADSKMRDDRTARAEADGSES